MSQRKESPPHDYHPLRNFLREVSIKSDPHSERLEAFFTLSSYYCCPRHCNTAKQNVLRRRAPYCLTPSQCLSPFVSVIHTILLPSSVVRQLTSNVIQQLSAKTSSPKYPHPSVGPSFSSLARFHGFSCWSVKCRAKQVRCASDLLCGTDLVRRMPSVTMSSNSTTSFRISVFSDPGGNQLYRRDLHIHRCFDDIMMRSQANQTLPPHHSPSQKSGFATQ